MKLYLLIIFAIAAMIRIYGLDKKFYWIDEVSSSFVITGNWPEKIDDKLTNSHGKTITAGDVLDALEKDPDFNSSNLLSALAKRDPQHSPLYFLVAQKWAAVFGSRAENLRLLASLFGILSLVAFTWLCLELFKSYFIAVISSSILALAPFHILYSQQNREYSLWFLMICVSTALLLAANRKGTRIYWLAYGVSVSVGLYSFLFFLPFLLAHMLFQIYEWRRSNNPYIKSFIISLSLGLVSFLPWLINILLSVEKVNNLNDWSSKPVSVSIYLQTMALNFSRLFVDFNLQTFRPLPISNAPILICIFFVVSLIIMSLAYTTKNLTAGYRVLLVSMFAVPMLFLLSMDAVKGGIHALVGRHLLPTWIAVYLAVGFFVASVLKSPIRLHRYFAGGALGLLFVLGIQFSWNYLPEKRWWPLKPENLANASAEIVKSKAEILITSAPLETKQFITVNYYLDRSFPVLIVPEGLGFIELKGYRKIAVFRPTEDLNNALSREYLLTKFNDELWIGERK